MSFNKEIEAGNFKNVYLLFGDEEYLIDDAIMRFKNKAIEGSFEALNYTILEGPSLEFEDILNACETLPFMAERKLVLVRDSLLFKQGNNIDARVKEMKKKLADYIEEINESTILLIVEKEETIRKNSRIYKAIEKRSGLVEINKLKAYDLENWIKIQFKNKGKDINRSNISYLIQQTGYTDRNSQKTLYDLKNEIDKIANFLEKREEVMKSDIEALVLKPLESFIFNLLDSITRKDSRESLRIFNEMYLSGEPVLIILSMISRQYRNLLNIKLLKDKGYGDWDIKKKASLSNFEYSKLSNSLSSFTKEQLIDFLDYNLEADRNIKMGLYDERLALEILISKLCNYR